MPTCEYGSSEDLDDKSSLTIQNNIDQMLYFLDHLVSYANQNFICSDKAAKYSSCSKSKVCSKWKMVLSNFLFIVYVDICVFTAAAAMLFLSPL